MYDYGIGTLEKYGLTAEGTSRTRGAVLCRTQKGLFLLREYWGSEKNTGHAATAFKKAVRGRIQCGSLPGKPGRAADNKE